MAPRAAERALRVTVGELATRTHREVMEAGRQVVQRSSTRWRRVTDGAPCGFCAMLASRGPVYTSKDTADGGRYHGRCGCTDEPFDGAFDDWRPTEAEQRYIDAYNASYESGIGPDELAARIEAWMADPSNVGQRVLMGYDASGAGFDAVTQAAVERVTDIIARLQGDIRRDITYTPLADAEVYTPGLNGFYSFTDKRVAIREGREHVLNTIAHESGHAIESKFGTRGSAAVQANRVNSSTAWRTWAKAVRGTRRYAELAKIKSSGAKYMRQFDELWARSYAQWVAKRSGDPAMLAEIAEMAGHETYGVRLYVWDDDDFESVAAAIDDVMKELAL